MKASDYQEQLMQYLPVIDGFDKQIDFAALGIVGEAGEASEIVKKYLYQGHPLDKWHLLRELGDVSNCLAYFANILEVPLEDIFQIGFNKMRDRYPNGFDPERSIHREADDI